VGVRFREREWLGGFVGLFGGYWGVGVGVGVV